MSTSLRRCILPLATLALVTACAEGPVGPAGTPDGPDAPDLSHFFPAGGTVAPTGLAFDIIGTADFTGATVIDFEAAPFAPVDGFYAGQGVTMTDLWGGFFVNTGTGVGNSQGACNFATGMYPSGQIHFSPAVIRAGFYVTTNDPDNTTVTAYMNGSLVGSEYFVTGGGGGDGSFAGVTFDGPFDLLVIDAEDNLNGAFCIDNLMFESGIEVILDIMPGTEINAINPRSRGKIPVAVLSTADFDAAAEVDASSLTFGATGDELSLDLRGGKNAVPNCGVEDVDGDGLADLVCHFDNRTANLQDGAEEGTLKGFTNDGTPLIGTDVVTVVGA